MRIKAFTKEHKNWDSYLEAFAFCLRSTVSQTTGFTANFLHMGREMRNPLVAREPQQPENLLPIQHALNTIKIMTESYDVARENIARSKTRMASQYNKSRISHDFHIGQLVLLDIHKLSDAGKKFSAGLAQKRSEEIYQIIDQFGPNSFKICELGTKNERDANADQLTLYLARPTHLK